MPNIFLLAHRDPEHLPWLTYSMSLSRGLNRYGKMFFYIPKKLLLQSILKWTFFLIKEGDTHKYADE